MDSSDETSLSAVDELTRRNAPRDGDEAFCSACGTSYAPELTTCPRDGARLVRFRSKGDPMIGRVLDERYEVRAPLGRGGMGTVYRAWQLSVDREVALKVVHASLAEDRSAAKRFLREARLASRLQQPNIVNVIDFGQTEDGVLYLVMEMLRGRTLAGVLAETPKLSFRRAAAIVMQLCDALDAAHILGIVHRDLKPGNIVLLDGPSDRQTVKVLDFGLAKSLVSESDSHVTQTDAILGTPLYMPPEAVQAKPLDYRGDIYSLGCLFHEMLSGRPPFYDPSVNVVMSMHLSEPPPMLPDDVPMAVAELVLSMMAKAPEHRVRSAADVRAQLETLLASTTSTGESAMPRGFATSPYGAAQTSLPVRPSGIPTMAFQTPARLPLAAPPPSTLMPVASAGTRIDPPRGRIGWRPFAIAGAAVALGLAIVGVMSSHRSGGASDAKAPAVAPATTTDAAVTPVTIQPPVAEQPVQPPQPSPVVTPIDPQTPTPTPTPAPTPTVAVDAGVAPARVKRAGKPKTPSPGVAPVQHETTLPHVGPPPPPPVDAGAPGLDFIAVPVPK